MYDTNPSHIDITIIPSPEAHTLKPACFLYAFNLRNHVFNSSRNYFTTWLQTHKDVFEILKVAFVI